MAEVGAEVNMQAIEEIAAQIAERFHPEKVILFGSYAYGAPTEDSDVDLLVIMEAGGNTLRTAASISAAIDHPFPLDILVWEPEQWHASVQRGGVFAKEVSTKGIVLYEA